MKNKWLYLQCIICLVHTCIMYNAKIIFFFSEISQSLSIYPHLLSYTLEFEMKLVFLFLFNIFRCKFMFSNVLPYGLIKINKYVWCKGKMHWKTFNGIIIPQIICSLFLSLGCVWMLYLEAMGNCCLIRKNNSTLQYKE